MFSTPLLRDCLPWLVLMALGVAALRLLWLWSGAQWRPAAARALLRDERGSVQSLSFVLTVPLFVMVMLFIVQLTQITIARLVVEYAAFAAVRSAAVWIPASLPDEPPNCIGRRTHVRRAGGPAGGSEVYRVEMVGPKAQRIHMAAAQACLAISPSRATPGVAPPPPDQLDALWAAYQATTPTPDDPPQRARVLANKLAYALQRTRVEMEVHHPRREPPLLPYVRRFPWWEEFAHNEIGWRDALTVTVSHDFALLPGPGKLLATTVERRDRVAERIVRRDGTYTYTLTSTMTLLNEGQKPVRRVAHPW